MSFKTSIRAFAKDESGVLLAEALILLPLLIWGFLALVVYWDVFRTINVSQKAAYSISDLVSRQGEIKQPFIDGMQTVMNFLTPNSPRAAMRITSIQYCKPTDNYRLLFSKSPGNVMTAYTQASIQALKTRVPVMADLDSVVIVETEVDYKPAFDIGILGVTSGVAAQTIQNFIVTRPRFYLRVCMDSPACPTPPCPP